MKIQLDAQGREIIRGQKLRCITPDNKGWLTAGEVYVSAGTRNNMVAVKDVPHGFAGWRFMVIESATPVVIGG